MKRRAAFRAARHLLASVIALGSLSERAAGEALPQACEFDGTFDEYVNALLGEGPPTVAAEAEDGVNEARKRPEGDGIGGGGLDRYKKLFVGLGLGDVEDGEKELIFNLRPDLLDFDALGFGSMRVVVHEPELFGSILNTLDQLPEAPRAVRREDLEDQLEDFDDVEYQLRWEFGESSAMARANRIAAEIFEEEYSRVQPHFQAAAKQLVLLRASLVKQGLDTAQSVSGFCRQAPSAVQVLDQVTAVGSEIEMTRGSLEGLLEGRGYSVVGDLIENDPVFVLNAFYRDRDELVGPSIGTAQLRFQMGDRSLWSWKRWAQRNGRGADLASFAEYMSESSSHKGKRILTLAADYSETARYRFDLPDDDLEVASPRARVLAATLGLGSKLPGDRSRIDLLARYEDADGDPERNNRFVATISWNQKLSDELAKIAGGSNLVVGLVYANRPEYRGEVDEELSLRAGLKWSIDDAEGTE